jgi:hypothetical protein
MCFHDSYLHYRWEKENIEIKLERKARVCLIHNSGIIKKEKDLYPFGDVNVI